MILDESLVLNMQKIGMSLFLPVLSSVISLIGKITGIITISCVLSLVFTDEIFSQDSIFKIVDIETLKGSDRTAITSIIETLTMEAKQKLLGKVDLQKIFSDKEQAKYFANIVYEISTKISSENKQLNFIRNLIPKKNFEKEFCNKNMARLAVSDLEYFKYDKTGKIIIPGGAKFWRSFLRSDLTADNFLRKIASDKRASIFLSYIASYRLNYEQINILDGVKLRLGENRKIKHRGIEGREVYYTANTYEYFVALVSVWDGDPQALRDALPNIYEDVVVYRFARLFFQGIPIQNERTIKAYYKHINFLYTPTREGQAETFNSILYIFNKLVNNNMIYVKDVDPLLMDLFDCTSEKEYMSWAEKSMTPVIAKRFDAIKLGVPDGNVSRDEVAWQEILISALVGAYTEDTMFVPDQKKLERMNYILDDQGIDKNNVREFMRGLAYSKNLILFPERLYKFIGKDFVKSHEFDGRDQNWHQAFSRLTSSGNIRVSGNILVIESELAHALQFAVILDALNKRSPLFKRYKNQNYEVYDRIGLFMFGKAPFYITFDMAQDYVYQTYLLGNEILSNPHSENEAKLRLWGLCSSNRLKDIFRVSSVAKIDEKVKITEEVISRMYPSEIYYLGQVFRGDPDYNSGVKDRIVEIKETLKKTGVPEETFQKEIDSIVGITLRSKKKFSVCMKFYHRHIGRMIHLIQKVKRRIGTFWQKE